MTELQNTEAAEPEMIASASEQEGGAVEENSPSASETQAEDKGNVQNRINKITAEKYAAQRELEQLKKKLESQPSQEPSAVQAPTDAPTLPEDIYDEEAMRKYHSDMTTYNQEQAKKAAIATYEEQQKSVVTAQQQAKDREMVQNYTQSGLESGLTVEQMEVDEQIIVNAGINPELGRYIMADADGAKIVNYLASNPEAMHTILSASPMQASVMIETQIKAKAKGPGNITKAADPVESVIGSGSTPALDPFEAGGGKFL